MAAPVSFCAARFVEVPDVGNNNTVAVGQQPMFCLCCGEPLAAPEGAAVGDKAEVCATVVGPDLLGVVVEVGEHLFRLPGDTPCDAVLVGRHQRGRLPQAEAGDRGGDGGDPAGARQGGPV